MTAEASESHFTGHILGVVEQLKLLHLNYVTKIINLSLIISTVPGSCKLAKKTGQDGKNLENFRLVSKL